MITYKHAKFIARAIESVLMQETNFPVELVIGEDKSPDDTRKIAEEYRQRYPDRIRLLARERNLGIINNFVETYLACRGTYVAILEGDDYWTDAKKLEAQVNALEAHPEWVMCFHKVRVFRDDGSQPAYLSPEDWREESTLDDLLRRNFIQTCSLMVRNGVVRKFPDWYFSLSMADWPFSVMLAQHGEVGYIDQVMADHRLHREGAWTGKDYECQSAGILEMLSHIRKILDPDRARHLSGQIVRRYIYLAEWQVRNGSPWKARSTLQALMRRESFVQRGFPYRWALNVVLQIEAPKVLRVISRIRRMAGLKDRSGRHQTSTTVE